MARKPALKPEQSFELNKSTLRALLRDMLKGAVDENDERIAVLYVMPFVQHSLLADELPSTTKDRQVFQAIDRLWLNEMRPRGFVEVTGHKALSSKHARQWIRFLYPEYIFFYPLRHSKAQPASITDASIAMSDVATLALIITNGDHQKAERLEFEEPGRSAFNQLAHALAEDGAATQLEKAVDMRIARTLEELVTLIHRYNRDHVGQPQSIRGPTATSPPVTKAQISSAEALAQPPPVASHDHLADVQPEFPALELYQSILEWKYPLTAGYRSPVFTIQASDGLGQNTSESTLHELLEKHRRVIISGNTGVGKSTVLTCAVMPIVRELGLVPILVHLAEYCSSDTLGDIRRFVTDSIGSTLQPGSLKREAFENELTQAIQGKRVVWLLDGYDELSEAERRSIAQEIDQLDRFVLTTRRIRPTLIHPIQASIQIERIRYEDAFAMVAATVSEDARERLERWSHNNDEIQQALERGMFLHAATKIARDPSQHLNLAAMVEQTIQWLLSRARSRNTLNGDLVEQMVQALGELVQHHRDFEGERFSATVKYPNSIGELPWPRFITSI